MTKLDYYLLGRKFTLVTDNDALKTLAKGAARDSKRTATRFDGWLLKMMTYDFEAEHISGINNVAADFRSCGVEDGKKVLEIGKIELEINSIVEMEELKTITNNTMKNDFLKTSFYLTVKEYLN